MFYWHTETPRALVILSTYIYIDRDLDQVLLYGSCRYLYCDEVSLEADTVLPTLYAAKKYILTHLAQACVDYLETNVDASNACLLLNQSRIYEEPELKQRCLEVIDSQAEEVLQSDSFADIEYESLKQILSRDSLGTKETVIFEAATRWAKAECTRQGRDVTPEQCREVLGDALYLLRLPTMSSNDFANGASQSGILSKQEIIDIFQYMSADNKPTLRFPTACRKGKLLTTCSRFHVTHKNWVFKTGKNNSIEFCVDKAISVAGFGLYGGGTVAEYTVGIALKHNNGTVLCEERHNISDDGSCNTIQVLFDRPVQIEPNTWYKVVFIEGCTRHGYYGSCGVYNVICDNIKFTFSDSAVAGNHTKVSVGQIPEILFLPLT